MSLTLFATCIPGRKNFVWPLEHVCQRPVCRRIGSICGDGPMQVLAHMQTTIEIASGLDYTMSIGLESYTAEVDTYQCQD